MQSHSHVQTKVSRSTCMGTFGRCFLLLLGLLWMFADHSVSPSIFKRPTPKIDSQTLFKTRNERHLSICTISWMVVSTPLKNISQLGWLFPIYGKIKHVPNHQPGVLFFVCRFNSFAASLFNLGWFGVFIHGSFISTVRCTHLSFISTESSASSVCTYPSSWWWRHGTLSWGMWSMLWIRVQLYSMIRGHIYGF